MLRGSLIEERKKSILWEKGFTRKKGGIRKILPFHLSQGRDASLLQSNLSKRVLEGKKREVSFSYQK